MTRLYSLSINVDLQAKPARDVRFDQCAINSIARIDLTFPISTMGWIIEEKFSFEYMLEHDVSDNENKYILSQLYCRSTIWYHRLVQSLEYLQEDIYGVFALHSIWDLACSLWRHITTSFSPLFPLYLSKDQLIS